MYDAFLDDPRIVFADEPDGIEPFRRSYTQQHQSFSPRVWNDAYLAAFARTADYQLVTFDQGFTRYDRVQCTILS